MSILWLIAVTLILALAVKQMAFILVHGSIFEGLRNAIRLKMENDVFGFEKLYELFSCKLCMTAQVSLWFVSLPLVVILHDARILQSTLGEGLSLLGIIFAYLVMWFLYSMALAGLAVFWWSFLEYHSSKYHALELELENTRSALDRARAELKDLGDIAHAQAHVNASVREVFTFEDFSKLAERIELECRGRACGFSRRSCRRGSLSDFLSEFWETRQNGHPESMRVDIREALDDVLRGYFRNRFMHKSSAAKLTSFRQLTYERMLAAID